MSELLTKVLATEPLIAVRGINFGFSGERPEFIAATRIREISFNLGTLAVHGKEFESAPAQFKCAILASLGFSRAAIGKTLFVGEDTVKTHLRLLYGKMQVPGSMSLASEFLARGVLSD
jgi:DNA-binding CsgD family transcriptional regulator